MDFGAGKKGVWAVADCRGARSNRRSFDSAQDDMWNKRGGGREDGSGVVQSRVPAAGPGHPGVAGVEMPQKQPQILRPAYPFACSRTRGAPCVRVLRMTLSRRMESRGRVDACFLTLAMDACGGGLFILAHRWLRADMECAIAGDAANGVISLDTPLRSFYERPIHRVGRVASVVHCVSAPHVEWT